MEDRYADWIMANYPGGSGYGKCAEATTAMVEAFPELRRVRGFYLCPGWDRREHWWLVAPDNAIVDPTAGQFPSKGSGDYEEWDESRKEPTGKCPNCGGYAYDGGTCCSKECHDAYAAYIRSGIL